MTTQPIPHRLDVPGAQLYYEVRGSGPLLLVVGQPMTSEPFGPVADLLAADHTVVTYDPHGLGQSTMTEALLPVTPRWRPTTWRTPSRRPSSRPTIRRSSFEC